MISHNMTPNLTTFNKGFAYNTSVINPHLLCLRVGQIMLFLLPFTVGLFTDITFGFIVGQYVVAVFLYSLFSLKFGFHFFQLFFHNDPLFIIYSISNAFTFNLYLVEFSIDFFLDIRWLFYGFLFDLFITFHFN